MGGNKVRTAIIVGLAMFMMGCGTNKSNNQENIDEKGQNIEEVTDNEGDTIKVEISTSTPWSKKTEVSQEEKDLVAEAKSAIEVDIADYKNGISVSILNKCLSNTSIFYSNRANYFEDITFNKYVVDNTNFEVKGIEAVDNLNAKILLKITYEDLNLSIYKAIKSGELTKEQLVTDKYATIREVIEKDTPNTKDSYIILNYSKIKDSNDYNYVTKNDIRKALTAGMIQGVSILGSDKDVNNKASDIVSKSLEGLQSLDLTDFYNTVALGMNGDKVKEVLENQGLDKARSYFASNTKVEIIDGRDNSYYKALVSYPNFNKVVNEGLIQNKNTNEIINNINQAIDNEEIDIVEDTLNSEISDEGSGLKLYYQYSRLLTNLGIDSIDMLLTDFSEPYTFNLKISGLESKNR